MRTLCEVPRVLRATAAKVERPRAQPVMQTNISATQGSRQRQPCVSLVHLLPASDKSKGAGNRKPLRSRPSVERRCALFETPRVSHAAAAKVVGPRAQTIGILDISKNLLRGPISGLRCSPYSRTAALLGPSLHRSLRFLNVPFVKSASAATAL